MIILFAQGLQQRMLRSILMAKAWALKEDIVGMCIYLILSSDYPNIIAIKK